MKFKLDIGKLKLNSIEPSIGGSIQHRSDVKFRHSESLNFELAGETHSVKFNDLKRKNANKILGDGASSVVFEMVHQDTEKSFAVKKVQEDFYYSQFESTNVFKEEDIIETSVLEKLKNSENVIQYYGYFYVERCIWIVSELMDLSLKDLYQRAEKSKKTVPEALLAKIASSVINAINKLESHGFMHRDIKPENILVNESGEIKLCDFGAVGKLNDKNECRDKQKGTVRYKAPEKFGKSENGYSIKSDLWSLGLTLLEIANLKKPFEKANNLLALEVAICNGEVPALNDDYKYSDDFKSFLALCLEKDVDKRVDCKTLLDHKFLNNATVGDQEVEFLREIIKESTE